jgi:hypothetical protein
VQLDAYRALSPQQRVEIAIRWSEELMALTRWCIRDRDPTWDDGAVTRELHRILGHTDLTGWEAQTPK